MTQDYLTKERIEYLLSIMKSALYKEDKKYEIEDEMLEVIKKNNLLTICYRNLELDQRSMAEVKYRSAIELQKTLQLKLLLDSLRGDDVELVLFKGIILANLYPSYFERVSTDADMYIREEDYHKIDKLLVKLGYKTLVEDCKYKPEDQVKRDGLNDSATIFLAEDGTFLEEITPKVGNYYNEEKSLYIEVHTCLWEDYRGKRMEALESFDLTNPSTYIRQKACGLDVITLGYTEHLIFQLFHIIKHFSLQGVGIRYLCDIVLFVNAYVSDIDWPRFWDSMKKLGYSGFCNVFFALGKEYLGMVEVPLNKTKNVTSEQMMVLAFDLFKRGKLDDEQVAWEIYGALIPYFTGDSVAANSATEKKIRYIFPSVSNLPNNYGYAKKYPVLLPIAWGHRAVLYFLRKINSKKGVSSTAFEKMKATNSRLSVMEEMGLMKNEDE